MCGGADGQPMTRSQRDTTPRGERADRPAVSPVRVLMNRHALSLREVIGFERVAFPRDWNGARPHAPATFTLAVDPERLYYVAGCAQAPDYDAALTPGAFAAGLWQRDVAELFIGIEGSPAYRELNLSPGGAWWSCAFSGYRQAAGGVAAPAAGVETLCKVSAAGWVAALAVPRAAVFPGGEIGRRTTLNVCMIVGGRDRRYLCWRPAAGRPDFHLPACFAPIELTTI